MRRGACTAVALLALVAAGGAQAMTSTYDCADGSVLTVSYTPKLAQVTHNGRQWTLKRAPPGGGGAQYHGTDATLSTQRSDAVWRAGGREWRCGLRRGG